MPPRCIGRPPLKRTSSGQKSKTESLLTVSTIFTVEESDIDKETEQIPEIPALTQEQQDITWRDIWAIVLELPKSSLHCVEVCADDLSLAHIWQRGSHEDAVNLEALNWSQVLRNEVQEAMRLCGARPMQIMKDI
ncbi:hypothetical protein M422DRAFT_49692 [Sphaerobolus stellatus SS14]|uniref:Uncharacterized protein n=1 Tax=Sphaerobolus stellatus (strain SS14) TaxID=990650 RepID=A0A0C9U8J2_SPHS4|nr:hypothetical protein M422DRAFT_49692 [Sphaerobolus stellatus SS14]